MTKQEQANEDSRIARCLRRLSSNWGFYPNDLSAKNLIMLTCFFLPKLVNGIETSDSVASSNSSNSNSPENNSPAFQDITATSWIISTIMMPLFLIMIYGIYCRYYNRPNRYQRMKETKPNKTQEHIVFTGDINNSRNEIDLSQVQISPKEVNNLTKKIILSTVIADLSVQEMKIFYVLALVWAMESESFCQLKGDKITYRSITRKASTFITKQSENYNIFTIFNNSAEAIALYLAVSQAIKEQQQQALLKVRTASNLFSMLYICGCMFSVFAAVYNNSHSSLLKRPYLIMPIAELMIFANGVANHLFCTKRAQIMLAYMLEQIFATSAPSQSGQNLPANNSRSYKNMILLAIGIIASSAFGFFASITNASLPFIAGSTLPKSWEITYGGFTSKEAIDGSKYLGDIFAAGTLLPISILYGSDAHKLGGKIYQMLAQIYQNGIKDTAQKAKTNFYRDPYLYLSHSILATIGTVRTIKFYQVINNRGLKIFMDNSWPLAIVNEFTLLAVIATIPLTFDSMITTSTRLYNYFTTRNEGITYSPSQQLMLAMAILNAVANSFLAMSTAHNVKTPGEIFWETFSSLAAGITSFAICTKFVGQPPNLETIKETKAWVREGRELNTQDSVELAQGLTNRLSSTRLAFSPGFGATPIPITKKLSLVNLADSNNIQEQK